MNRSEENRDGTTYPSYLALIDSGAFAERLTKLERILESCRLCPRACGVNRLDDEKGSCGVGRRAVVSSAHPHFGEEPPLVGHSGSGTIFLSGCNLKCLFCQNYEISQELAGAPVSPQELASLMLRLQEIGCHNLNLVSPTHVVPQILRGLEAAAGGGFRLPIVYNTGGYDSIEVIRLLEGVIDIYMPDLKYLSPALALAYSNAEDYPDVVREVIREMHRQVGDLEISSGGVAARGLLIRHLVMPDALDDTERIVTFIAEEISQATYVNIMRQYHPAYRALTMPPLDRPTSHHEWTAATRLAAAKGLHRLAR